MCYSYKCKHLYDINETLQNQQKILYLPTIQLDTHILKTSQTNRKSNKPKGTQIGNFIVSFDKGEFRAVKITAVSGHWNIRFREDNPLYSFISTEPNTKEGRDILNMVFLMYYAISNAILEAMLIEDIFIAYKLSIERMQECIGKLSDKEHDDILEEEKLIYNQRNNESAN